MTPSKAEISKYFGYSPTAFQKWREVKDPIQKAKLEARFEALKEYYINHSKGDMMNIVQIAQTLDRDIPLDEAVFVAIT